MNYQVRSNIYRTPDGAATYDSGGDKNELVLVAGAVVSEKEAERLKLPALDEKATAQVSQEAHLSDLEPFVDSAPKAKGPAKKVDEPTKAQEIKS